MLSLALLGLGSVFYVGCTHPNVVNSEITAEITLNDVEDLSIGQIKQSDVSRKFGSPQQVVLSTDGSRVVWIYVDKRLRLPRLSLYFDAQSGILHKKKWEVYTGEAELNLETLKTRYQAAKLTRVDPKWKNSDAAPGVAYFIDQKHGLSIEFNKSRREVENITWSLKNSRSVADSEPKTK